MRDHYFFDERTYRAIGAHGGKILSIGMPVTIVVEKVDTEENKIDFSFEYGFEEERDPMEKHLSKGRVKEPHKVKKGGRSGRGGASRGSSPRVSSSRGGLGRSGAGGFAGKPRSSGGRSGRSRGRGRR